MGILGGIGKALGGIGKAVGGVAAGAAGAAVGGPFGAALGKSLFDGLLGEGMAKGGSAMIQQLIAPMLNELLSEIGSDE